MFRIQIGLSLLALCVAIFSPSLSLADSDSGFPHIAVYNGTNSWGYPIVKNDTALPPLSRPLDQTMVDAYAGFGLSILHATPLVDARKDIANAIRAKNPNTKVFAYVMPETMWCGEGYLTSTYFSKYWRLLKEGAAPSCLEDTNKFLFLQDGRQAYDVFTISNNMAFREQNQDGSYRYPLAESIAQLIYDAVIQSKDANGRPIVDGVFNDVYCTDIAWMESPGSQFDHVRAGYSDHAEFLAGWRAGSQAYATKLRALVGDNNYPIIGNCGMPDPSYRSKVNGWMAENFPWQGGGSWYSNMFGSNGGYFNLEKKALAPQLNIFSSWAGGPYENQDGSVNSSVYSDANCKTFRYTLASTSLGNGFADIVPDGASTVTYARWRFPEHAVNPVTGKPGDQFTHGRWLGSALSDYDQLIWASETSLLANPSFETDLSSWRLAPFPPAAGTYTREVSDAPHGQAALHAHISTAGAGGWQFAVSPTGTFAVDAWSKYSVTFWAKSDREGREISVVFARPSDGFTYGALQIPITQSWKQYQIFFTAPQSGTGHCRFDLGLETGDVWLDNIRMQQGVSSVFRRKFEKGMVLVNPDNSAINVNLDATYRKIWDDKTLCPGYSYPTEQARRVNSVTIAGWDGVFLLNPDSTPPDKPAVRVTLNPN